MPVEEALRGLVLGALDVIRRIGLDDDLADVPAPATLEVGPYRRDRYDGDVVLVAEPGRSLGREDPDHPEGDPLDLDQLPDRRVGIPVEAVAARGLADDI